VRLSPLNQRRWQNFRKNGRAFWSLIIFSVLLVVCLCAELVANDKPLLVKYQGGYYTPVLSFYPETTFGGDFQTEAEYPAPEVICLIETGGLEACFDDPESTIADAEDGQFEGEAVDAGWILWPPVPYSFNTINYGVVQAPSAPDANHIFGTDDQTRDVLARVIYGFRISVMFALIVTLCSTILGVIAGAVQGYFGGIIDLIFQRLIEIWQATPVLYVIIIMGAIFTMSFTLLTFLIVLFSWTALVGVVRAEFLRGRNLEYVRAARALGVSDWTIMFRHMLPNAMVATVSLLPFVLTGAISMLTGLDFLGYGLPASYPSLGELALQAKNNLQSPHLAVAAFVAITLLLSLLVFIFEGVRDAFDPRKTFQ